MTDRPDSDGSSHDSSRESSQDSSQERDSKTRKQGAVYQGAFEAVGAILITTLFGYWLDGYFDTSPVLLLVGVAIGFASFTVRLVRLGRSIEEQGAQHSVDTEHSKSEDENET